MDKANISYSADIFIDGVAISTLGLRVLRLPALEIPKRRVSKIVIPGRADTLTETDGSYEPLEKTATLFYQGDDPLGAIGVLRSGKRVTFSNEQDFSYDYRIDDRQTLPRMLLDWHRFEWKFFCQPLKRQAVPELRTGTSMTLTNPGNESARPVIEITGSGNVTLTVGAQVITLAAIGTAPVTIDSENRTIVQSGASAAHKMTGPFPEIPAGATVSISVTGTVSAMKVWPNWRWS